MRMRQSMAELEQEFIRESVQDRRRREGLRRQAAARSRQRRRYREYKRGSVRFILLVLSMITTAVVVTILMFEMLAWVLG